MICCLVSDSSLVGKADGQLAPEELRRHSRQARRDDVASWNIANEVRRSIPLDED